MNRQGGSNLESLEAFRFIKTVQQHVKIDESGVGPPAREGTMHALVVERLPETEPALQAIAGTHIIAGEDVQTSEPSKQYILGSPAAYTPKLIQTLDSLFIAQVSHRLEVQAPLGAYSAPAPRAHYGVHRTWLPSTKALSESFSTRCHKMRAEHMHVQSNIQRDVQPGNFLSFKEVTKDCHDQRQSECALADSDQR